MINIEVDGASHLHERKKRFCKLRDKYLLSKGMYTIRIDNIDVINMDEDQLMFWIKNRVFDLMTSLHLPLPSQTIKKKYN